jgi:hypothetical protein
VGDDAARAGAALPGGAHRAKEDGARGQVQIGVVGDDDGVVAAQLQNGAAKAPGHGLADAAAGANRAGEGDQRQALVVGHELTHGAVAHGEGKDAADAVVGHDLVGDVLDGNGR